MGVLNIESSYSQLKSAQKYKEMDIRIGWDLKADHTVRVLV